MWEKMSIRRELPHVTLPCISLWVNHYRSISHNHFWSIQHNHSDHHRVILSQSMSTRSMDSQVWRPTTCHLNLSMSPDTIRAIYLGPLHFVDYDGWDQTSFIVSGTGLLVTLCHAAHVFSLLACEKNVSITLVWTMLTNNFINWLAASFYFSFPRKFHLEKNLLGYDCSK